MYGANSQNEFDSYVRAFQQGQQGYLALEHELDSRPLAHSIYISAESPVLVARYTHALKNPAPRQ